MKLGELDADRGLTVTERVERRLQCRRDSKRRLVADERMLLLRVLREPIAERTRPTRRKTAERERRSGKSAHEERHIDRARAGDHLVGHPFLRTCADQPVTGIGDPRIAAVRAQRHLLAGCHVRDDPLGDAFLVALPVGDHLGTRNLEMREELPCPARILARDHRGGPERLHGPRREVGEISNRCCYHMQHFVTYDFKHRAGEPSVQKLGATPPDPSVSPCLCV